MAIRHNTPACVGKHWHRLPETPRESADTFRGRKSSPCGRSGFPPPPSLELVGMAKLLENPRLANEHLPTQILISLLKSSAPAMRENAVKRLLERNLDKDLAEAASGLDEAGKSIVIQYVAADRERFGRRYGPLNDFLIASAKANPEATFEAIDKSTAWDQAVYLDPSLPGLRKFLREPRFRGIGRTGEYRGLSAGGPGQARHALRQPHRPAEKAGRQRGLFRDEGRNSVIGASLFRCTGSAAAIDTTGLRAVIPLTDAFCWARRQGCGNEAGSADANPLPDENSTR